MYGVCDWKNVNVWTQPGMLEHMTAQPQNFTFTSALHLHFCGFKHFCLPTTSSAFVWLHICYGRHTGATVWPVWANGHTGATVAPLCKHVLIWSGDCHFCGFTVWQPYKYRKWFLFAAQCLNLRAQAFNKSPELLIFKRLRMLYCGILCLFQLLLGLLWAKIPWNAREVEHLLVWNEQLDWGISSCYHDFPWKRPYHCSKQDGLTPPPRSRRCK